MQIDWWIVASWILTAIPIGLIGGQIEQAFESRYRKPHKLRAALCRAAITFVGMGSMFLLAFLGKLSWKGPSGIVGEQLSLMAMNIATISYSAARHEPGRK